MVPGTEGGITRHQPDGEQMSIYERRMKYQNEGVPLVVLAGQEYGTGSSRDWAAKARVCSGSRPSSRKSFERIHRSNLVGMGVLPLQFKENTTRPDPRPRRHRAIRCPWPGRATQAAAGGHAPNQADERQDGRRGGQVPHRYAD